jgi:hypothetical protein
MYGVLWYFVCLGLLRYFFRWAWTPALVLACPIAIGALILGAQLWGIFASLD